MIKISSEVFNNFKLVILFIISNTYIINNLFDLTLINILLYYLRNNIDILYNTLLYSDG